MPLLRWDNKEEFQNLSTYPHHQHDDKGNVKASALTGNPAIDIDVVLKEISAFIADEDING
jgi:phage terminase large subunit-like protein